MIFCISYGIFLKLKVELIKIDKLTIKIKIDNMNYKKQKGVVRRSLLSAIALLARHSFSEGGAKADGEDGFIQAPTFQKKSGAGFTLIEILVVIGIIAVLALIVLVAINPARQFALARNTQRTSNIQAILNAVGQRMVDNKGIFNGATGCTAAIPTTTTPTIMVGQSGGFDLACLAPTYISSIPFDPNPNLGTASSTGYTITADANGRVTVCAPGGSETAISGSAEICITR